MPTSVVVVVGSDCVICWHVIRSSLVRFSIYAGTERLQAIFSFFSVSDCAKVPYMSKYNYERFDLRMTLKERQVLEKLAKKRGVTMSKYVKDFIKRAGKRERL